jgi:murein DD-endopeptidase MepM/ murein hydrolase activator NlpD
MKKNLKKFAFIIFLIILAGYLIPQQLQMPVQGASIQSYAQNSYWAYPWGKSVTHKGVDIFAKRGTEINSATNGIVIFKGQIKLGGNVVMVLGPKWRLHYYAHLDSIQTGMFSIVSHSTPIGTVGTTGNAQGKPPHLHYTVKTIFPYPWRIDNSIQGWRKMFYLNPIVYLNESFATNKSL